MMTFGRSTTAVSGGEEHLLERGGIALPGRCGGIGEFVERDRCGLIKRPALILRSSCMCAQTPRGVAHVDAERPDVGPGTSIICIVGTLLYRTSIALESKNRI